MHDFSERLAVATLTALAGILLFRKHRRNKLAQQWAVKAPALAKPLPLLAVKAPASSFQLALDAFDQCHGNRLHKDRFVLVPVRRGIEEMSPLINAALAYGAHIAGGAARWMVSPVANPVPTADIDIFPPDQSVFEALEATLMHMGYEKYRGGRADMALTFMHPGLKSPTRFVQLVVPRKEKHMNTAATNVEELLASLDFTVSRAVIVSTGYALVDVDFERDERLRLLRVRHIVCPISSVRRIAKYTTKGYRCRMLEIIKLFAEWSRRAEANPDRIQLDAPKEVTPTQLLEMFSRRARGVLEAEVADQAEDVSAIILGLYVD
jgi:hypothetical protein